MDAGLREQLPSRFSFARVEMIPSGHAAGLMALERAVRWISQGAAELCLVGGVETYLEPETLEWLDENEQLKSEANRWGFIPGEAAGFCLLATPEVVARYRIEPLASAAAEEKVRPGGDAVCLGEGLTRAMREVLGALPAEGRVDRVICDLNGERYRTDEYGFTIARLGQRFVDATDTWTPADCWGDVGAASGPLFVCLAAASGLRRYARGPRVMVWASSHGGERGAALIELPENSRRA